MILFPESIIEYQKQFATEEACEAALAKIRWPHGFVCPNCDHDDGYQLTDRRQIQCVLCRHQTSVTAGTIFHKTHLPLTCWFWIIYQVTQDKGGASATRLAAQLNRPYKTMWFVLHKIRHAMGQRDEPISLAGLIEFDEAVLGPEARRPTRIEDEVPGLESVNRPLAKPYGAKAKDGRLRKSVIEVLALVEAERFHAGNVVLRVLPKKSFETIREVVQEKVDENQWFRTDAFHSHWVLRQLSTNFKLIKSSDGDGCQALPVVHRVISLLKHYLMGTYFGVSVKYLQLYLNEFCFRFMRREKQTILPESLLRACVFALPFNYAELTL